MAEVALEAPQGGIPGVGLAGFKVPADVSMRATASRALSRTLFRSLQWFRTQAGSPSLGREGRLYQGLPSRPRHRIVCWKRFAALP